MEIKKFADFFWYSIIEESAWFTAFLTFIFKRDFFSSKQNMEMIKSEKLLKKKKRLGGFFSIWHQPRKSVVFRAFLTPIFNNFLKQLLNSQKIRPWKFQVNLVSSFRDISKKLKGRAFCPHPHPPNKIGF